MIHFQNKPYEKIQKLSYYLKISLTNSVLVWILKIYKWVFKARSQNSQILSPKIVQMSHFEHARTTRSWTYFSLFNHYFEYKIFVGTIKFRLVTNQSEKCSYNLNFVSINLNPPSSIHLTTFLFSISKHNAADSYSFPIFSIPYLFFFKFL